MLAASDLMGLEQYARERDEFRARVIRHKRARTVPIGPHMTWIFEDRLTIQYQVQEMLRIERIFEAEGIREELDAYNPLIPDGGNWKATMLIEFPDLDERQQALARMIGIEDRCFVRIGDHALVTAVADEDLERTNEEKTSAVHWLRFELTEPMCAAVAKGAAVAAGTDHPAYRHEVRLNPRTVSALASDLD